MMWFILGLFFGFLMEWNFGLVCSILKLTRRSRKRFKKVQQIVDKNPDTKLSEIVKSGRLPEFLDYLERETPPAPRMDDLYKIYREQEKRDKINKELQKWVDRL